MSESEFTPYIGIEPTSSEEDSFLEIISSREGVRKLLQRIINTDDEPRLGEILSSLSFAGTTAETAERNRTTSLDRYSDGTYSEKDFNGFAQDVTDTLQAAADALNKLRELHEKHKKRE